MKTLRAIGSWWVTAGLIMALAMLYTLFASKDGAFERWMHAVFHTPWGLAVYFVLMVNLATASIRAIRERLNISLTPASIRDMDAHLKVPVAAFTEGVQDWMADKGFGSITEEPTGVLLARKGKFCFIPGTVMRAGLIILMAAFLFSTFLKESDEANFGASEARKLLDREISLGSIEAALPGDFLQVGDKSAFVLKEVKAAVTAGGRKVTVTNGFPSSVNGLYLRITGLGYRQGVEIEGQRESLDLDVLPPGRAREIEGLPEGSSISFTLEPEKTITKGLLTGKLYDLKNPRYHISVKSGGRTREAVTKPPAEAMPGIDFGEPSLYVRLAVVRDPALPWVYGGLILTLIGVALMPARLFWYERRLCAYSSGGSVLLGHSEEFYGKWGVMKFSRWGRQLMEASAGEGTSGQVPAVDEPHPAKGHEDSPDKGP